MLRISYISSAPFQLISILTGNVIEAFMTYEERWPMKNVYILMNRWCNSIYEKTPLRIEQQVPEKYANVTLNFVKLGTHYTTTL